jgi:hypothetical protein
MHAHESQHACKRDSSACAHLAKHPKLEVQSRLSELPEASLFRIGRDIEPQSTQLPVRSSDGAIYYIDHIELKNRNSKGAASGKMIGYRAARGSNRSSVATPKICCSLLSA